MTIVFQHRSLGSLMPPGKGDSMQICIYTPYRVHIKLKFISGNKVKKVIMCQQFHNKIGLSADYLNDIWFSNKAHFLLSGHVNIKNSILRETSSPNEKLSYHVTQRGAHHEQPCQNIASLDHCGWKIKMRSHSP